MTYIKIGERLMEAEINGLLVDKNWSNRNSKTIRCAMTFAEAAETFVDDLAWSIVYKPEPYLNEDGEMVQPEAEIYDNSDYCVAGDITDHRDGTVSVKMGKLTDAELLAIIMGGA